MLTEKTPTCANISSCCNEGTRLVHLRTKTRSILNQTPNLASWSLHLPQTQKPQEQSQSWLYSQVSTGPISRYVPFTPLQLGAQTALAHLHPNIVSFCAVACVAGLCITLSQAMDALSRLEVWSVVVVCILAFIVLLNTFLIWRHPQSNVKASFMVRTLYRCIHNRKILLCDKG